ncbi:hypothetical protein BDF14DRAFT_1345266 [Spinellus fusiger]|nr:hypothetical protein BDF14DRAFT_1345266 [Spinellus fusiger]
MIRSKTWLSPLEPLLQKYRASPILEKQELARELLGYIEDHRFQQSIQTVDSSFKTENLSANPNRPILGRYELDTQAYPTKQLNSVQGIHAYLNGPTTEHPKQKSPEKQTLHRTRQTRASASSLPIHSSILLQQSLHRPDLHPQTMFAAPNKQSSMLSSLLALELQDTDMTALAPLTTEAFGALWTESTYERKYSLEHTSSHLSFADDLCVQWHLLKVEMIDNELIASHNSGRPILVHAAMQSNGVVDVTLRALTLADLDYFLCGIDLHHSTVGE